MGGEALLRRVVRIAHKYSRFFFHPVAGLFEGGQHRVAVFRAPGLQVEFYPGVVQGQLPGQTVVEQVEDVGPLLLLPIVVGGFIIVTSLIKFSTALTFFYDQGRVLVGCALRTTRRTRASPPLGVTQQELGNERK